MTNRIIVGLHRLNKTAKDIKQSESVKLQQE